jgi:hypothetical protein
MPQWPFTTHRRRATADGWTVSVVVDSDGVEFLSLPPLRYHRGEAQPSIRAVLGGKRQWSCLYIMKTL